MTRPSLAVATRASAWQARRRVGAAVLALAALSMAHVGSPNTFFGGKAGPYDVRVTVRLPGVIPGRAQVTVRVAGVTDPVSHQVTVRAGQWNVGLEGAPPPEAAAPVPGDASLYSSELWFMTPSSYQLAVAIDGPAGHGAVVIPVLALATAERPMPSWLGAALAALGVFLTAGLLTIVGSAVRESGLPPGAQPDASRRVRARFGIAIAGLLAALALWGGNRWWAAEASSYSRSVLYRPFDAVASVANGPALSLSKGDRRVLTLSIRDERWSGTPNPRSRYNALMPDHGKLMHLFLVRDQRLDALAHLHPIPRSATGLDFDVDVPRLPAGRYRVYGDIVHESGFAQTLVSSVDLADGSADNARPEPVDQPPRSALRRSAVASAKAEGRAQDPDDSWFSGASVPEAAAVTYDLGNDTRLVWTRGESPIVAGVERDLRFSVQDATGADVAVEPYMGMAAHLVVASRDGSVFAHLHPSGSVSMAAMQRFAGATGADAHTGHAMTLDGRVAVPYAFPKAGPYRLFVQVKRAGRVLTSAFDVDVKS
jgi:hypothetical protein